MKVLLSLSLLCLLVEVHTNVQTYPLHYRGAALCTNFTSSKTSVGSVIKCAALALSVNAPAYAYCEGEAADCILAASNYNVGTWATSGPSCLLYSSYLPLPPPLPRPQSTKKFVLSTGSATAGDLTSLSTQNLCAADGLQFAVVATAAEHQLLLDQVGAEIHSRCHYYCVAWYWLNSALQWKDGSVVNQCDFIIGRNYVGACLAQNYKTKELWTFPCTNANGFPVVCQTYV